MKEKSEKRQRLTIFDFYRNTTKDKIKLPDDIVKADFKPFDMGRFFSFDKRNIFFADALNRNLFSVPKNAAYLYYFYACDKVKKVPFLNIRKDSFDDDFDKLLPIAKIFLPEMSKEKIKEVFPLIKDKLIELEEEISNEGFKMTKSQLKNSKIKQKKQSRRKKR